MMTYVPKSQRGKKYCYLLRMVDGLRSYEATAQSQMDASDKIAEELDIDATVLSTIVARIYENGKIVFQDKEEFTDKELQQLKIDDAFHWINRNYGGKKVKLNPVSMLKENQRLVAPFTEEQFIEGIKRAEKELNLKIDWWKYEHYKRLRQPTLWEKTQ
jgi:hypothetical protein